MSTSNIIQLRQQIEQELVAMHQGLNGLAAGTARHTFISAKMRRIDVQRKQLAQHIGHDQAIAFSCQAYIRVIGEVEQQ